MAVIGRRGGDQQASTHHALSPVANCVSVRVRVSPARAQEIARGRPAIQYWHACVPRHVAFRCCDTHTWLALLLHRTVFAGMASMAVNSTTAVAVHVAGYACTFRE